MNTAAQPLVLQVLTRLGAGGPPLSVILITRELNRAGYATRLVTGRCDHVDLDMSYLLEPGDPVEWVPEMSRSLSLRNDLTALWRLYRIMRRTRPAIVQTHTAKAGALGRIAAWLAGVPIVIHTFHGHVLSGYFSPARSAAIRMAERLLARITGTICVLSPQQARDLVDRFHVASAQQVRVVPLGLDLEPFRALRRREKTSPETGDGLTVGWLGRFVEVKNIELLVRVIGETLRGNDRIRFLIAGDGGGRPMVQAAVAQYGEERVKWVGWKRDVASVIAQCDVLIQTSRNEGTPVALIQGMSAGRPFVSTAAGGIVDMVEGPVLREASGCRWFANAVLADADPVAFASALLELEASPQLLADMGYAASSLACTRYNLENLAANYERLYSELLETRPRWGRTPSRQAVPQLPD